MLAGMTNSWDFCQLRGRGPTKDPDAPIRWPLTYTSVGMVIPVRYTAQIGARSEGGVHSTRYHPDPVLAGRLMAQSSGKVTGAASCVPGGVADPDKTNCARVSVWTRESAASKDPPPNRATTTMPVATRA